jgi:predicted transcriptional regulator
MSKQQTFYLDDELYAALVKEAERQERSASYIIRAAISAYLGKRKGSK